MKAILVVLAASVLWAQPEDAAANSQRARELVVAGKVEEAIPIYLELAREFPDNAAILVNLSIAEFKAKHYRDAAAHASAALRLQPDSPAANLFLGSSYEELGEHLLALPPLERVLAGNPQERNARLMLAEALLNLERYEEAAAQFQKASELAPEIRKSGMGLAAPSMRCPKMLSASSKTQARIAILACSGGRSISQTKAIWECVHAVPPCTGRPRYSARRSRGSCDRVRTDRPACLGRHRNTTRAPNRARL